MCYIDEWKKGSKKQMQYVTDAITRAGYQDFPNMLRTNTAEVILEVANNNKNKINLIDVGFGLSAVVIAETLYNSNFDLDRLFITGFEPSEKRAKFSEEKLKDLGLRPGQHFKVFYESDWKIPDFIEPESQDIVTYVAILHHHAYID